MACARRTDRHIPGLHCFDFSVIIVFRRSLHDVEELRLALVNVKADPASRIQCNIREKTALAAQIFRPSDELSDDDGPVAAPHMFIISYA